MRACIVLIQNYFSNLSYNNKSAYYNEFLQHNTCALCQYYFNTVERYIQQYIVLHNLAYSTCRHSIRIQLLLRTYCVFLRVLYSSQEMRIVFLGVVALTLLHWSNAECPSSLSLNVITCQPEEDIGVCIRNHLKFGGNGCISVPLSEGTYYLSERFEVVNRSVSITSTGLGVSVVCNLSSTFSQRAVFSVKEAEFAELKGVNFSSCSHTVEFVRVRTVNIIGATFE